MSRTTFAIFSAVLLGACADQPLEGVEGRDADQSAIYGGSFALDAHHTSVVAITTFTLPRHNVFCTGTLIESDVVLTAAHCLDEAGFFAQNYNEMEPGDIKIGFGHAAKHAGGLDYVTVSDVEIYSGYDRTQLGVNDIALIRLDNPAPAGFDPVPALPLSDALDAGDIGATVDFVGYGTNDMSGIKYGSKLHVEGNIDVINQTTVEYSQVAGGPCSGDSGGPMFIERNNGWFVAGITSWGSGNCDGFGAFGVSTAVDVYESFIQGF